MCLKFERIDQGFVIAPQGGDTSARVSVHISSVGRWWPSLLRALRGFGKV